MKKVCIAIGMVWCFIQGHTFYDGVQAISNAKITTSLVEEKRINDIVAEINAARAVTTDYPFGYALSESKIDEMRDGWIKRHPVLIGTIVGFGAGFAIGYAGGDDGIFYDFSGWGMGSFLSELDLESEHLLES